jgi:hypothetical protein
MHERCDCCGRQFDVLAIVFTEGKYLCKECAAKGVLASRFRHHFG